MYYQCSECTAAKKSDFIRYRYLEDGEKIYICTNCNGETALDFQQKTEYLLIAKHKFQFAIRKREKFEVEIYSPNKGNYMRKFIYFEICESLKHAKIVCHEVRDYLCS